MLCHRAICVMICACKVNVSCHKELEQLKLSSSTKSQYRQIYHRKTQGSSVKSNQRYPVSTTHILQKFSDFCCKIETSAAFHIYFASNITLVLRFMISNKFYCIQTAKVNSIDVSC